MFYHLGKNSKKPLSGLATTFPPPSLFVQGFLDVYISQQISMMNTFAISLASYFPPASLHFINVGDPSAVIGIRTLYRNLPAINGLAVDWFGNNIYWLVEDQIMVSRTDGRYLKTLRVDSSMDSNLMLDPERGYEYILFYYLIFEILKLFQRWYENAFTPAMKA